MAVCPRCGVEIDFGDLNGERIPLDAHEQMRGEHRYLKRPAGLVPVAPDADVLAYVDHRTMCSRSPNA